MFYSYLRFTDVRVVAMRHHMASPWLMSTMVWTQYNAPQQVI
jgi:hypothetical protein